MKPAIFILFFLGAVSGTAWWWWQDAAPIVVVEIVKRGEVKHSSPGRVEVSPKRAQNLSSLRIGRVESVIMTPNSASRKVSEGELIVQLETRDVDWSWRTSGWV